MQYMRKNYEKRTWKKTLVAHFDVILVHYPNEHSKEIHKTNARPTIKISLIYSNVGHIRSHNKKFPRDINHDITFIAVLYAEPIYFKIWRRK